MPLVTVRNWYLSESELRNAVEVLPDLVSEALTVPSNPDAELTPEDIEVFVERGDTADIHGLDNCQTFAVTVEAMYFPKRAAMIQEATDKIRQGLVEILPATRAFVWVTLPAAAGFAEIHPTDKK